MVLGQPKISSLVWLNKKPKNVPFSNEAKKLKRQGYGHSNLILYPSKM